MGMFCRVGRGRQDRQRYARCGLSFRERQQKTLDAAALCKEPPSLSIDRWNPGIGAQRLYPAGLCHESVPGAAGGVNDSIIIGEQPMREETFLEIKPDALDRVQFGRVVGQRDKDDVGRNGEVVRAMPAGLIEHHHGMVDPQRWFRKSGRGRPASPPYRHRASPPRRHCPCLAQRPRRYRRRVKRLSQSQADARRASTRYRKRGSSGRCAPHPGRTGEGACLSGLPIPYRRPRQLLCGSNPKAHRDRKKPPRHARIDFGFGQFAEHRRSPDPSYGQRRHENPPSIRIMPIGNHDLVHLQNRSSATEVVLRYGGGVGWCFPCASQWHGLGSRGSNKST